ncbi:M81 family metallopeptidase [Paenibacillus eucommiae]|uniref:Microcystin degradation protein MlrC n=1 Tax=Paenibacillus eucommiae TaxID=1355755 RepID=A0ABS4IVR5_9BACL|nr:M81 family metallopeptidase [Paenibacillus eucommiae]MBP1991669.1 microcystin degradation protein MlrC [Paenibacillus eucommiae]
MKIAIATIVQESNSFSPVICSLEDFQKFALLIGKDMDQIRDVKNEVYGFYKAAAEEGAELVPLMFAFAGASGIASAACASELKALLISQFSEQTGYDGILLMLHGAMVSEDSDDFEGDLLEELRKLTDSRIPIMATFDSHAHMTRKIVDNVTALVGYRTYPHQDFVETGYKAVKLLFSIIKGDVKPTLAMVKVPMILPAETMQTNCGPMAELIKEAVVGEKRGDAIVTSLFAVQPWLDVEGLGFAVVTVALDEQGAESEAWRLARMAWEMRHQFEVKLHSVEEIIRLIEKDASDEPFIISDSADSPSAGGTGDSNIVLSQLLQLGVQNKYPCLLYMVDAPAVMKCIAKGVGSTVELSVGYSVNRKHGNPILITGVVTKIGEGRFKLGRGHADNQPVYMGRCVVVQIGKISLLLSELATVVFDPALYRCMGLEPSGAKLVLVKSAAQFKAGYKEISTRTYILDTIGFATCQFEKLEYRKVTRPVYPLEDDFEW